MQLDGQPSLGALERVSQELGKTSEVPVCHHRPRRKHWAAELRGDDVQQLQLGCSVRADSQEARAQ